MSKMDEVLEIVNRAIITKGELNLQESGKEYIAYQKDENIWVDSESESVDSKVLQIPSPFFMTVEYCVRSSGRGYTVATYTPGRLPIKKKCLMFCGDEEDVGQHRHNYYELTYVLEGRRVMQVEDRKIVLEKNDMLIFDMKCSHLDIRTESEGKAFYCGMTEKLVDSFFLANIRSRHVRDFFLTKGELNAESGILILHAREEQCGEIMDNLARAFWEMEQDKVGADRIAGIYLLRLLNEIGDQRDSYIAFDKKLRGTKLFNAVAKYISSNLAAISLEKLSEQFFFQKDYFNRLIKKNTGMSYSEYVKNLRMEKAKNLLVNTDLPVKDILVYIGYERHAFFYKNFQKNTGLTPCEYRNRYSGKDAT